MISLKKYSDYMASLAIRAGIASAVALTVDDNMAKTIAATRSEGPVLFYLAPVGRPGSSNANVMRDLSACVLFVMVDYDPQHLSAYDALAGAQPYAERLKQLLAEDSASGCSPLCVDLSTVNTMPETQFYRSWAGWSIGFSTTR